MKKLIAAALVGTMVLTMAGCGSKTAETTGSEASSDAAGGTLVMATNAEFPPYEYYEGGEGKIVGIDIDMAQAIADLLKMELEVQDIAFDSIVTSVQTGKADIGVAGLTVDEDRLQYVNFSEPYTTSEQVIIVRAK